MDYIHGLRLAPDVLCLLLFSYFCFYGRPMEQGRPLYFCPVVSSSFMVALCNSADHIYFHPVVCSFFFFLLFVFPHLISAVEDWMSAILPHMVWPYSANLGCRSETCCMRLAGNTGRKTITKKSPSPHHRTILSGHIFATKARIDNRKNLLRSNISSTCSHNMVNFGLLAAEIDPVLWGTPANFNGFRCLAALLHGSQVVRQPHFAALNRRRHLCSAGRPSGWALANILVLSFFPRLISAIADWMSAILPDMVWP